MSAAVQPNPQLAIIPGDERHLDAIMGVMHAAFDPAYNEAWSLAQVASALLSSAGYARLALVGEEASGFSLCRMAADEAELLLIAVAPAWRRLGVADRLLLRAREDAAARGACALFLEVREDNSPARMLYSRAGFVEVGRRPGYYLIRDGTRRSSITMKLAF
jgi:ribosomal-protein-alanine N-acetyltransferase